MDSHWWSLRKAVTHIHVTYGHDYDRTLFATDVQMQKGPPIAIRVDLERNLRTRVKGVATFVEALDLAEGRIKTLKRMDFRDAHILERLRRHLHYTENKTTPWRLLINLGGEHEFAVEPEYSEPDHLVLRVTGEVI